jgi:hypothetical protein
MVKASILKYYRYISHNTMSMLQSKLQSKFLSTVPSNVLDIIGRFKYETMAADPKAFRAARKIQRFTRSRLPDQHSPRCERCGEELYYSQHGRLCPLCSHAERGQGRGHDASFRTARPTRSKKTRRRKKLRRGKKQQRSKSARRKLKNNK